MDKNAQKRWRPLVSAICQNLTPDEATEAILTLLDAPTRFAPVVPAESPEPARRPSRAGAVGTENSIDPESEYTVSQVALLLGLEKSTVYGLTRNGDIPNQRDSQGRVLVRGTELIAYRDARKAKTAEG